MTGGAVAKSITWCLGDLDILLTIFHFSVLISLIASFSSHVANNSGVNKRQITDLVDQSIQINTHCFVVTADNRYILVCGFWDKSFRVYSTETGWFLYYL